MDSAQHWSISGVRQIVALYEQFWSLFPFHNGPKKLVKVPLLQVRIDWSNVKNESENIKTMLGIGSNECLFARFYFKRINASITIYVYKSS